MREREVFWTDHEGEGFLTPIDNALKSDLMHAINVIISKVISMKREIAPITSGPLTNAVAIIKEPHIIENVKEAFVMGGVTRLSAGFNLPFREHNIYCDPEGAKVIFNCTIRGQFHLNRTPPTFKILNEQSFIISCMTIIPALSVRTRCKKL